MILHEIYVEKFLKSHQVNLILAVFSSLKTTVRRRPKEVASVAVRRQEKLHHYLASFRLIRVAAKHGDSRTTVASEASARPWVSKKNNRRERKAKR